MTSSRYHRAVNTPGKTPLSAAVVVLTTGERKSALEALDASLAAGTSATEGARRCELVLVANTAEPVFMPTWKVVTAGTNLGIPGGRNFGVADTDADVVFFLDDDAVALTPDLVERCLAMFEANPQVGAIGFRLVVSGTNRTLKRWNPRLGARQVEHPGEVTAFPGGASAVRRNAFDEVGGFCSEFFYALEETDLAWRLLDKGWSVRYEPGLLLEHPETVIGRHVGALRQTARNRVWVARRNLPVPVAALYVSLWFLRTVILERSMQSIRSMWQGSVEGLQTLPGTRRPLQWATIWKMTRQGRPPII